MMQAKVIEHSVSPAGKEICTLQLVYPRFIHAEAKTHRVISQSGEEIVVLTQDAGFMSDTGLSRNASSSRAIPVAKMIEQVRNNPAMPVHWGANQPGMQAKAELEGQALELAMRAWKRAANEAADTAEFMEKIGLHKQVANRIMEPFQNIHVIVTATEWDNFFELRDHEDAQPEIRVLARLMNLAMMASAPRQVGINAEDANNWHLPYITQEERKAMCDQPWLLAQISAARCARVSYLTHDGQTPTIAKDLALYERLVGSVPLHASPVEHQAHAAPEWEQSGNFVGWIQNRKLVEAEMFSR